MNDLTGSLKKLVIIGAGGFGREVADTVMRINQTQATYELQGFADDDESLKGMIVNGVEVLGNKEWLKEFAQSREIYGVVAIANAHVKRKITEYLGEAVNWENIIDPSALISPSARMGKGNIVQPFVVIGPNTEIGNHCMINVRSNVGHDARLEDFVSIMSICDVTGGVVVKEGAYLATSVSAVPQTVIGKNAFVCAGAVVLKDVEEAAQVIGYPAKRIK